MKPRGLILSALLCLWTLTASGQEKSPLPIGAARADITPGYPIRLHGYGGRTTNSQGVAQKIWAKALAFGTDADGPRILITLDNLGVPGSMTDQLAARLASNGIKREALAVCASHTHSAPLLTGVAPNIFSSDIIPEQQATIERYTRELLDKLEKLSLDALASRAPSKLSWNEGTVTFAKNRRVIRGGRAQFGENDTAPVDHTLATMFVRDSNNNVRAVLANYACHCTTLGGEWNQVHGDWAGTAQRAIELQNPGAVALISIGCGADANPAPRGSVNNAEAHGEAIAAEIRRMVELPAKPLTVLPAAQLKRFDLDFDPLPTKQQWEERAKRPGIVGYHARKNLGRLNRGETLPTTLPYSVQTWTFGNDLAMVFLPGEVVIDYQLRLKREFDASRLWVNAYANDAPCYIPSRRILTEGGYEAEDSLWYYDRPARLAMSSEDRIIKAVHELLPAQFIAKTNRAELRPLSPQEALNTFRVAPEFAVELAAAEPLIVDPVAIDWGSDGKLWVVEMHDYPMGLDGNWKPGGRVKFLQDTNNDGRYDTSTLFLDGLPFPTGVFAWRKGALICAAPDILYAEDTNNDGRADIVRKVFTGFATNNYQARVNSLSLGLDGWVYGANGLLGGTIRRGESAMTGAPAWLNSSLPLNGELDIRGRDFRMHPDTGAFEPASGLTQQGRVRDDFGNWFGCDNSRLLLHYPLPDEFARRNPHVAAPAASVHVPQGKDWNRLYPASRTLERFNDATHANRVTSACGLEIYRDQHLGAEFYGNAFTCEAVHNLVHREVLEPDGVTFRSARSTNEPSREFLASSDNWFRPVQVRTGPDGALWVVDMYRHVIEHPRWIPSNRLAQLEVRAGDDKGRIYRVYRKGQRPGAIRPLSPMSTAELAGALDSSNGTHRDMVQRELLHRGDKSAAPVLTRLAGNAPHPATRVHALAILVNLNAASPEFVSERFLAERDPQARAQILNLANLLGKPSRTLAESVRDPDIRVRYQAAFLLHGSDEAEAFLRELLPEAASNQWIRAAVLSSAAHAPKLLAEADALPPSKGKEELFRGLVATVSANSSGEQQLRVVEALAPRNPGASTVARFEALATLGRKLPADSWSRPSMQAALRLAKSVAAEEAQPLGLRAAAVRFAAADKTLPPAVEWLRPFLKPGAIQRAAMEGLLERADATVPGLLLAEWSQFTPTDRTRILERLGSQPNWIESLLAAVERRTISPAEVSLPLRSRLLDHTNTTIRARAGQLWQARASNRGEVIASYRKQLTTPGNAQRGAEAFDSHCAACHALQGRGTAVGPDLSPWRDKTADDFLLAILDPSAAIEPRFVNYIIETKKGGMFMGVIRSETATSLELVSPGVHEKLLRSDIAKIETAPASLMPEGLEQVITPAEVSDLIAFLKKPAPRAFGSGSEAQIQEARQEFSGRQPKGAIRLTGASERLNYPGWLGFLPLLHCRQTDGTSRVAWQVNPGKTERHIVLPAAMGFKSAPPGKFVLKVNGKPAIDFDVVLDDAEWAGAGGKVRMNYSVMEANAEDSNGILTISIAPELLTNGVATFEVIGSAANSQRWFGIYDVTDIVAAAR